MCRVQHLVLRGDKAALLPDLSSAASLLSLELADCATLKQLPVGLGQCRHLTSLKFTEW